MFLNENKGVVGFKEVNVLIDLSIRFFDLTRYSGPLHIVLSVFDAHSVELTKAILHQDECDVRDTGNFNSVESINFADNAVWLVEEMLVVGWQQLDQRINILLVYGFDYEPFVVAEKEETAAGSQAFSSFLDAFVVLGDIE